MNKLQKVLIIKSIAYFLVLLLALLFGYVCTINSFVAEITLYIIIGGILIAWISAVIYYNTKRVVEDYKIRGCLSEEEYKVYSSTRDYGKMGIEMVYLPINKEERVIYDNAIKKLKNNKIKY